MSKNKLNLAAQGWCNFGFHCFLQLLEARVFALKLVDDFIVAATKKSFSKLN